MWRNLWSGKIYLNKIENSGGGLEYEKSGLNIEKLSLSQEFLPLLCFFGALWLKISKHNI